MKKKFDWNAPFSRKDLAVLAAVVTLLYTVACACICWESIAPWIKEKVNKIRGIEDNTDDFEE